MLKDIYDPLSEYINVFRDRFKEVAENTFAELATEAQVDIEANQNTCRQLYAQQELYASAQTSVRCWSALRTLLWIAVAVGLFVLFFGQEKFDSNTLLWVGIGTALSFFFLLAVVYPRLKKLKNERDDLGNEVDKLQNEAWEQMSPLNRLYDWDVLTRMMTQTVPKLEFDPYFTTQRLADLKMTYGWDDSFNSERSVIYSHSGLINGNPFIICRTRRMEMGSKTYVGSKTIHWTTRERGADGKYETVSHSETLTASVTAPYPEYPEKTRLIYGNTAAPNLIFYRKQSGLAGKEGTLSYKWKRRSLIKQARDLSNQDFAMMSNEEFEVAFNTSNRNNNQQYALLFTPLAQESMMNLLKDREVGYGDDFDFEKHLMINTIVSNHMQELNLDLNPQQYRHFDYAKAKNDFYTINAQYFRAIYFSLAPLLCVPMYQQIRPLHDIYGRDMLRRSSFWEHEALANFWGEEHFKHASCVTPCILKTEERRSNNDEATLTVRAYGYRAEQRVAYIKKWGGDGRLHSVPVYWDEYLPVTGRGTIYMKEDNEKEDPAASQTQRLSHIHQVLHQSRLDLYRRHIASRV